MSVIQCKKLIVKNIMYIGSDTQYLPSELWIFESLSIWEYHNKVTGDAHGSVEESVETGSAIIKDRMFLSPDQDGRAKHFSQDFTKIKEGNWAK